jgi:hypothetical protein
MSSTSPLSSMKKQQQQMLDQTIITFVSFMPAAI